MMKRNFSTYYKDSSNKTIITNNDIAQSIFSYLEKPKLLLKHINKKPTETNFYFFTGFNNKKRFIAICIKDPYEINPVTKNGIYKCVSIMLFNDVKFERIIDIQSAPMPFDNWSAIDKKIKVVDIINPQIFSSFCSEEEINNYMDISITCCEAVFALKFLPNLLWLNNILKSKNSLHILEVAQFLNTDNLPFEKSTSKQKIDRSWSVSDPNKFIIAYVKAEIDDCLKSLQDTPRNMQAAGRGVFGSLLFKPSEIPENLREYFNPNYFVTNNKSEWSNEIFWDKFAECFLYYFKIFVANNILIWQYIYQVKIQIHEATQHDGVGDKLYAIGLPPNFRKGIGGSLYAFATNKLCIDDALKFSSENQFKNKLGEICGKSCETLATGKIQNQILNVEKLIQLGISTLIDNVITIGLSINKIDDKTDSSLFDVIINTLRDKKISEISLTDPDFVN